MTWTKRDFLKFTAGAVAFAFAGAGCAVAETISKLVLSEEEWRKKLSEEQYYILREEGTERAYTSALNNEKRDGTYHCAGCDLALFESDTKYDSGTGWPSFYDVIPDRVGTKTDYKIFFPRTEYHCTRCGGHQGHVFEDGPEPTGLRYCNNGLALTFKPKTA
ncbi:MAG: peptide-methionine (R)-S-oxide reductase MsrB [Hyphomicrobiaceae bacterium]|nr:peptide-methionine (R)-S-oxide reductase MsrB [Hyphomicrobiaceae bacterium]